MGVAHPWRFWSFGFRWLRNTPPEEIFGRTPLLNLHEEKYDPEDFFS